MALLVDMRIFTILLVGHYISSQKSEPCACFLDAAAGRDLYLFLIWAIFWEASLYASNIWLPEASVQNF